MDSEHLQSFFKDLTPIVISGLGAFIFSLIVFRLANVIFRKIKRDQYERLKKIRVPVTLILVLIALYVSTNIKFEVVGKGWEQAFKVAFIISFTWFLLQLIAIGRMLLIRQYDISARDNLEARKAYTQIRVFERIFMVIIIILAVALSLMTFESIRSFGASILASAGIAGIIIGVAAQKLIANLLAGFQIAVTQPIRIDDVVIIQDEWGWIEEITLTYVVVRVWDKRRLIVPSSQFIENAFQNWTRTSAEILGTVFIHADYTLPVSELRQELTAILQNTPLWDKKVNVLQVTDLTEKTMKLRALVSAKDSPTAWDLRVHVREKLIEFLQKNYPDCLPKSRVELDSNK